MKHTAFVAGLLAASFLCACDAQKSSGSGAAAAESSAPAVDPKKRFENDLNALGDEVQAIQAASSGNPAEDAKKVIAVAEKLQTVDTSGLPADLVDAFDAVKVNMGKSVELMKRLPDNMPTSEAEMPEWVANNPQALQALMEIGEQMPAIQLEA